jgi:hypothetical protein
MDDGVNDEEGTEDNPISKEVALRFHIRPSWSIYISKEYFSLNFAKSEIVRMEKRYTDVFETPSRYIVILRENKGTHHCRMVGKRTGCQ